MPWPTGQEYSEVVQNPRSAFGDPELQGGRIETDRLGLPKPRSGNFAVVYKVDCGSRSWAVKCFTGRVPDQQRRYDAISAHLRAAMLPYMVDFDYLREGIRLRGQRFPLLKMEWVSGDPLIRYVQSRLRDPASILALASRWVAMMKALRVARIAHGDLQHGNVLVVGGDLKLVDYDGMFVPALAGERPTEDGHPNYQHPGRATMRFGPDLDNFSSWTIYVSLVALSIDPSLWDRVGAGDDCLLFRGHDFAALDNAHVFKVLEASADERLRSLIEVYRELVVLRAEQVPPLGEAKIPVRVTPPPSRSPSWLDDHLKVPPPAENAQAEAVHIDAAWVLDFVTPIAPPGRFVHSVLPLRLALVASIMATGAALITLQSFGLPPPALNFVVALASIFLIELNFALIVQNYRREPDVASLRLARSELRGAKKRFRAAEAEMAALKKRKKAREARRDRDVDAALHKIEAANKEAKREADDMNRRLVKACAPTLKRRTQIERDERRDLAKAAQGIGARVADLRNELSTLAQGEAMALATALKTLQAAHLHYALSRATVSQAQIQGVGPHLKRALTANGIVSALDVHQWKIRRIRGFGPARVTAVLVWAKSVEAYARATMLHTLPVSEARTIRERYEGQRQALAAALQKAEDQQRAEEAAIKKKYAPMRQQIDSWEAAPRAAAQGELRAIEGRLDHRVRLLKREEERAVEDARRDLAALDAKTTNMRRSSFGLQWEKARATARVKAYAPVTFGRYLCYIVFGLGHAA
jgi:hypothetical protein